MLAASLVVSSVFYLQTMGSSHLEFSTISVAYSNEFPHFSDRLFYLQFSPRVGEFPIFSIMIFIIREGLEVLERGYFYPGFCSDPEYPFNGNYLQLVVATVLRNQSIDIQVKFNESANFRQFEIRYGEYVSREKMLFAKKNYLLYTQVRYSQIVHLYVRSRLELRTLTLDGRSDGLLVDEPGFLVCKGSRGYPEQPVEIRGQHQYEVLESLFDSVSNTHRIKAVFKLHHHKSRFQCATRFARDELEIHIFHHPSLVHLEPAYYSTVPNGSNVQCVADDGYPEPKVQWYFINGPFNYDWYFNIFESQLFILPNAPIGSMWAFNCVAENVIPNSRINSTSFVFKFSIVHSSTMARLIIAASCTGIVLLLAALIVGLVIAFHPRCRQSRAAGKVRNNNCAAPATLRKELAFDPDTAGSLRLSNSTECLPTDELPRYEETTQLDNKYCPGPAQGFGKDNNSHTCYV